MNDHSADYEFDVLVIQPNQTGVKIESVLQLTDYFDDKGHLHRYKVRDFLKKTLLEENLSSVVKKDKKKN